MFYNIPITPIGMGYSSVITPTPSIPTFNPMMSNIPPITQLPDNGSIFNINIPQYTFGTMPNIGFIPPIKFSDYSFKMPSLNFNTQTAAKSEEKKSGTNTTKLSRSLTDVGYNLTSAKKLAEAAEKEHVGRFDGQCARHVKTAIQNAGLGKYVQGDAKDMDDILDKNPNFKRVNISLEEAKTTPGIVLVYNQGVAGYSSTYGHTETTDGKGCAYSGGKTRNIRKGFIAYAPVA